MISRMTAIQQSRHRVRTHRHRPVLLDGSRCQFGTRVQLTIRSDGILMFENWKQWALIIKRDAHALYLTARDPRVPWYAKVLAIAVAAYALSPINLIPDFVPVLGYVDDLIIVPAGIALVVRLVPPEIMTQHRDMAMEAQDRPVSWAAGVAIITIWIVTIGLAIWIAMR